MTLLGTTMTVLLCQAPVGEPPPAPVPNPWKGNVGVGLTYVTGNSQNVVAEGALALDRTWADWAFGLRLSGAYGLVNPVANISGSTSLVTARRAGFTVRGDRTLGGSLASLFVLAGGEFDHLKSIESRTVGELGTGLTFLNQSVGDLERLYLRVDVALRAGYETHYQYFPEAPVDPYGIVLLAPRAAATFRWALSKDVRLSEELEVLPFLLAPTTGRVLVNNRTKLSVRLVDSVSLTTSLLINYDSSPPLPAAGAAPRLSTDLALMVGVEAAF